MPKRFLFVVSTFFFIQGLLMAQSKYSEKGLASYYADRFDGRKTASGEIFRNTKMTAAHKKLPFGTMLKVTNLKNGKTVIVRVNDRGPYAHGRIIDLSKAAAGKIGMIEDGLAEVRIESVTSDEESQESIALETNGNNKHTSKVISIWGTEREASGFGIQLASFENRESAIDYGKDIYDKGVELPLIKMHTEKGKTYYRVMAGMFNSEEEADAYKRILGKKGLKGFVKTYE